MKYSTRCFIFLNQILQPKSSLHCLLPPPRDKSLIAKLRVPRKYPVLASRAKKYQSFINFALLHYQWICSRFSCCTLRLMHCCYYVLSTWHLLYFIVLCCIVLALAIHSAYFIKRFSLLTAMMSNKLLGLGHHQFQRWPRAVLAYRIFDWRGSFVRVLPTSCSLLTPGIGTVIQRAMHAVDLWRLWVCNREAIVEPRYILKVERWRQRSRNQKCRNRSWS